MFVFLRESLCTPAPRQLGVERSQWSSPEAFERREPQTGLSHSVGSHRIEPTCPVCPDRCETVLAQDAQVLGNRRLADAELVGDHRSDGTGWDVTLRDQLEDSPTDRIAEDVECVHNLVFTRPLI